MEIRKIQFELLALARRKSAGYTAGSADAIENYRDIGIYGVISRIVDKSSRLRSYLRTQQASDESLTEVLSDIILIAEIALVMMKGK